MIAPVSLLPGAANDARAPRPVYFQTRASAIHYARKLAQNESRDSLVTAVRFVENAFTPAGGGRCFAVELAAPGDDYQVRELSPAELARRVQTGMRATVERLLADADRWAADAEKSRFGSVRAEFFRYARNSREQAREIETQLTVASVRKVEEPFYSSERDSRAEASR